MEQDLSDQDVLWSVRAAAGRTEEGKRRAALVDALVVAINEKQTGKKKSKAASFPSPTEYYVAALSALATHLSGGDAQLEGTESSTTLCGDLLYLMSKIIPSVPVAVARLDSEAAFASLLAATGRSNNLGARSGIAALSHLLVFQAKETWNKPIVVKTFRAILSKVTDDNPKVRRAAQESVSFVLDKAAATTQALQLTLEVMGSVLGSASSSDRNVLKFLYFAKLVASRFTGKRKVLGEAREIILNLIEHSTNVEIITQALKTFIDYIQVTESLKEDESGLSGGEKDEETFKLILERLIKCFKFTKFPLLPWAEALAAVSNKSRSNKHLAIRGILQVLRDEVINEADLDQVSRSLFAITSSERFDEDEDNGDAVKCTESFLTIGLHAQSQRVWQFTIPSLCVLVDMRLNGDDHAQLIRSLAMKAVEARESLVDWKTGEEKTDAPWKRTIEHLIAVCAERLGPDAFLHAVPLFMSKEDQNINPARICLLKPLKEAWRNPQNDLVRLATFRSIILRLAKFTEESASEAKSNGLVQNAKMFHTRTVQLWGLLPAFCSGASDLAESFPSLAKLMAQALQDDESPELGPIVSQALVSLVRSVVGFDKFANGLSSSSSSSGGVSGGAIMDADMLHSRFGGMTLKSKKTQKSRKSRFVEKEDEEEEDDEDEEEDDDEEEAALKIEKTAATSDSVGDIQRRIRSDEERERDLAILRKFAPNFLPLLFNSYDAAYRSKSQLDTNYFASIEALCQVADAKYLATLFRQLVQKLLIAVNNDDHETARALMAIASALVPGLSNDEADVLLRAVKPHLVESGKEGDEGLQKRAFVCLMRLVKAPNLVEWTNEHREDLIDVLQQSLLANVKSSVKCTRLICLRKLLLPSSSSSSDDNNQQMRLRVKDLSSELLGEVLLSMKEVNSQTRSAGFDLFTDMAHRMDEDGALEDFFQMTVAGLAATTPHMRSCTILALCRLVALYGSRADVAEICAQSCIASFQLFQEKSREVARSLITLSKVCAIKLEIPVLKESVLPHLLRGILPWSLDTKNRFSMKIRVVFDKLIKRVGMEEIVNTGIIPPDHRLLMYIKRQHSLKRNRKEASLNGQDQARRGGARSGRRGNDNNDEDEDDMMEITQSGADPVNLLDPSSLANMSRKKRSRRDDDDDDNEDDFKRDSDGRIIIEDDEEEKAKKEDVKASKKKKMRRENENDEDEDEDDDDEEEEEDSRQQQRKQPKKKKRPEQQFGKEFKARKAGGDAKYKGMKTDPYAYIPLDHRMLNKRKRNQAVKKFVGIGKGAKKGYRKRSGSQE